ncbi:hypothetical protein AX17_001898 [Amanita inopinata Kibby_2008]|nr:hypothetical protein AX17_001898 [Amanita inopinata Kibby_2008]
MSRRASNNVRGPTSALTEFLRESGITPTTVARRAATRNQDQPEQTQQPVAGPSRELEDGGVENDSVPHNDGEQAVEGASRKSARLRGRLPASNGYATDELDESEGNEDGALLTKRRKRTKVSAVKLKANGKKKPVDDDNDFDPQEDDVYTALSRSLRTGESSARPPIGSFERCAECDKQFTVTKYTISANPGPGFLCHQCAKATSSDPYKKPAVKRKRKTPADKRNVQSFEERRFPTLVSVCIQLITKHIDDVEALGDIGTVNMEAIAKALAKNRCLTPENVHLFYNTENTSLVLYDCTNLCAPALQSLPMLNPSLTSLRLDYCGHLDTNAFSAMSISLPHLERIELLGPFLIRPEAWIQFFKTHSQLQGFLVTQCPRFNLECVESLMKGCQELRELRLKEMKITDDWLTEICGKPPKQLKSLDLSSPETSCSEEALIRLLRKVGRELETLDLSRHDSIADGFLDDGLAKWTGRLERLSLVACPEITDRAMSRLFNSWTGDISTGDTDNSNQEESLHNDAAEDIDGPVRSWNAMANRSRAATRRANMQTRSRCSDALPCHNVPFVAIELGRNHLLGSQSLLSIMRHSGVRLELLNMNSWKDVSPESLKEVANYASELKRIDVGWCRAVDDFILAGWVGINMESDGKPTKGGCLKLKEIKVWGCNRVTGKFPRGRGVDICGIEFQNC